MKKKNVFVESKRPVTVSHPFPPLSLTSFLETQLIRQNFLKANKNLFSRLLIFLLNQVFGSMTPSAPCSLSFRYQAIALGDRFVNQNREASFFSLTVFFTTPALLTTDWRHNSDMISYIIIYRRHQVLAINSTLETASTPMLLPAPGRSSSGVTLGHDENHRAWTSHWALVLRSGRGTLVPKKKRGKMISMLHLDVYL